MTAKLINPTSARNIRKSLIKFKKSANVTDGEVVEPTPQILEYRALMAKARTQAADMFEVYRNQGFADCVQYVEAHPPSAYAVATVIRLAEASDDPEKPSRLGKQKAEKLYGKEKSEARAAWDVYQQSAKYKSKNHFVQGYAKLLTISGKALAATTIYRWLPKAKK